MFKNKINFVLYFLFFLFAGNYFIPTKPSEELYKRIDFELQRFNADFKTPEYAILIDYNKNVFSKRLWVIDLLTKKIVLNSHVSHAKKSGYFYATRFSNKVSSKISSKGVFITQGTYKSKHGKGIYQIGMRLKGLEKDINDQVFIRNIVFHTSNGLWSEGCFMTIPDVNKEIIDLTKNGNILIVN